MDEYVKREDVIDAVLDVYYDNPDIDLSGEKFKVAILKLQRADVTPVKHGMWLHKNTLGEHAWFCSKCKTIGSPAWKCCPVCETRMDCECDS